MAMPITRQVDLIPLLGSLGTKGAFRKLVAEAAGCQPEEILGSDLFLYNREKAKIWGAEGEYLCPGPGRPAMRLGHHGGFPPGQGGQEHSRVLHL